MRSRLADHYHPLPTDPIEHVPVVELLTAMELAAEDLNGLCRQVPGGDMITPAHWKQAVQVAGYLQKANDIYSYLLPIFSPVTGLVRLGTQQWMVKPAWKNMQQNLLRWFYRAYRQPPGHAPDRALQRPAGHRRRPVPTAHPQVGQGGNRDRQ